MAGMLFTSPTPAFPWAFAIQQLLEEKQAEGEDVLCSLEARGTFLPCFGHHSMGPVPRWWGGSMLALQSLVPRSLSWMFSLLFPG